LKTKIWFNEKVTFTKLIIFRKVHGHKIEMAIHVYNFTELLIVNKINGSKLQHRNSHYRTLHAFKLVARILSQHDSY
jgi:hypothetical protein